MAHFSLSLKLSAIVDPAVADVLADPWRCHTRGRYIKSGLWISFL